MKDEVAIKLIDLLKSRLELLLQDSWETLVLGIKYNTKIHNHFC